MKKVSVVVPVFNTKREYLQECLDSVMASTHPFVECVVVDDGSDPETAEWLDEYAKNVETLRERERERASTRSQAYCGTHAKPRRECRA